MSFGNKGSQNQQPVANAPPASPADVPLFPTKEQILAQPIPNPQLTTQQQITHAIPYISDVVSKIPPSVSASDIIVKLVEGGIMSPTSVLTLLGQLPVDIHKTTGALGETFVEPQGRYNLGIRSPGEPKPVTDLDRIQRELNILREITKSKPQEPDLASKQTADSTTSMADAFPGPYLSKLNPTDEAAFQQWVKQNKIPFDPSPTADYDMRGFWSALQKGDPRAVTAVNPSDQRMHFPDTWKTPYHKSFSNESIYARQSAPHWEGNKLIDKNGNVIVDETPAK